MKRSVTPAQIFGRHRSKAGRLADYWGKAEATGNVVARWRPNWLFGQGRGKRLGATLSCSLVRVGRASIAEGVRAGSRPSAGD
jgi:hypothetical protein